MKEQLEQIKKKALTELETINTTKALQAFDVHYLGRKGQLTSILRQIKDLSKDERPVVGKLANEVKRTIVQAFKKQKNLIGRVSRPATSALEMTWPGAHKQIGHLHPITRFMREVQNVFISMGFEIVQGREVETPKYNFDLLNIPKDHPTRDVWDTYYLEKGLVLRTHTSPVQLRAMESRKPPVRLIVPGRVFRHEATDAGHETTFYQCEGLAIDKGISVANLIGTLDMFLKAVFGPQVKTRVRPELYPFVEPGMDVDMQCLICNGVGCSVCKQRGWLEMLGSGMVHPKVLKNMGVDPDEYSGFAFGLGIDRLMMLKYGVNDIRLSYRGDLRFLEQF